MYGRNFIDGRRPGLLAAVALMGAVLTGSASAGEPSRKALREDGETCASFGARYGSRQHSECMLAQQQRRDDAPLRAAEQQRLSAETARSNLEMVRRMRCDREAKRDRENGQRPRSCR